MKTKQKCEKKRKINFSNKDGRSMTRTYKWRRGLQFTEEN
jgi:hypothetical protein